MLLMHAKLIFLYGVSVTAVLYPGKDHYCFAGIQEALAIVPFNGPPEATEDNYYNVYCENSLRAQSVFLCARKYCSPHEVNAGYVFSDL